MRVFALSIVALALGACDGSSFSGNGSKSAGKATKAETQPTPEKKPDTKSESAGTASGSGSASGPGSAPIGPQSDDAKQDLSEFNCERGQAGFAGKLYKVPTLTLSLPNFDDLTAIGQVSAKNLDVGTRDFKKGFPGVPDLIEWFAIRFSAQLDVPADGAYSFKTASDDGSKVYLDHSLIVTNDGIHGSQEKESEPVQLTKGVSRLVVEWYQGPGASLALQLFWKKPGDQGWAIVPPSVLSHGSDCNLQKVGEFPSDDAGSGS